MMSELMRKKFSYGLTKQKRKEIMSWRDITRKSLATSGIWDNEKTSPFKSIHLQESSVHFDNDPFAYDEDDDFSIKDTKKVTPKNVTPKKITPKKITPKKITPKKVTPKKVSQKKECKENFTDKKEKSVPRLCEQISGKELPDQAVSITVEEVKSLGSPKKYHRNSCSSNISEVKDVFSFKNDKKLKVLEHQKEQAEECSVTFINEFDILVVKDSAINKKQKSPHVTKNYSIKKAKKKKDNQIAMNFIEDPNDDCIDFQVLETKSSPCVNTAITVDSYDTLELPFEKTGTDIYNSDMFQSTQEDCCKTLTPQESLQKDSICSLSNSSQEKKTDVKPGKMKSSLFSYYSDLKKDKNKRTNIFSHSNKLHISKDDDEFDHCEESHSGTTVQRGMAGAIEVSTSPKMKRQKTDQLEDSSSNINGNQGENIDKIPGPKSPFKSYKTTLQHRIIANRRRLSALPTDITTDCTALEEDIDKEENDDHISHVLPETTMFNFHRPANNPVRVPRKYKHLYVVVKNTKRAHECFEDGQNQQLEDDVEYLLDGLKPSHTISTRCLSALDLALKSITPGFRMHLKAHGIIPKVFGLLEDALEDEQLALCTATFMYTLAKDRSTIDFNKANIDFLIKLLSKKTSGLNESKDFPRIKSKIQTLLEKLDETNIDKDGIDAVSICRETLLLLTSKRIGNWFKDEIRKLGGLDHLTDTIYTFSKCIQKRKEHSKSYHPMDRYLNLLEDVILQSPDNQNYLVSYRDGILLESCIRCINTLSHQIDLANDFSVAMQNCLFSTLKIMTDLSHENANGCAIICKEDGSLNCVLRCALHIPQYLPEESKFDFVAVSLGLLINLVEHSQQNVSFLNATFSPACCESQSSEDIDNFTAVEALMQLFLVRIEMCKEGDLMEELDKLEDENREREAALHYEDDEFALICGDRFDDTVLDAVQQEVAQTDLNEVDQKEKEAVEKVQSSSQETLNASEKQDIKNTLDKAHKHMEDSHVAAYTALLIGLLLENNQANQQLVHSLLPEGDFKLMQDMLIKILSFMKITNATNERGLKVIERVIELYDSCSKQFPRRQ